jgi:hypothetical protein
MRLYSDDTDELINLFREYVALLEKELASSTVFLFVHGIHADDDAVQRGAQLREQIAALVVQECPGSNEGSAMRFNEEKGMELLNVWMIAQMTGDEQATAENLFIRLRDECQEEE